jgi:hypothetical protein
LWAGRIELRADSGGLSCGWKAARIRSVMSALYEVECVGALEYVESLRVPAKMGDSSGLPSLSLDSCVESLRVPAKMGDSSGLPSLSLDSYVSR